MVWASVLMVSPTQRAEDATREQAKPHPRMAAETQLSEPVIFTQFNGQCIKLQLCYLEK